MSLAWRDLTASGLHWVVDALKAPGSSNLAPSRRPPRTSEPGPPGHQLGARSSAPPPPKSRTPAASEVTPSGIELQPRN